MRPIFESDIRLFVVAHVENNVLCGADGQLALALLGDFAFQREVGLLCRMQVAVRMGDSVGARLPYRERPHTEKQNDSEAAARSSHGVVAPGGPFSKPNVGLDTNATPVWLSVAVPVY